MNAVVAQCLQSKNTTRPMPGHKKHAQLCSWCPCGMCSVVWYTNYGPQKRDSWSKHIYKYSCTVQLHSTAFMITRLSQKTKLLYIFQPNSTCVKQTN